jgi:hypothetical protein
MYSRRWLGKLGDAPLEQLVGDDYQEQSSELHAKTFPVLAVSVSSSQHRLPGGHPTDPFSSARAAVLRPRPLALIPIRLETLG